MTHRQRGNTLMGLIIGLVLGLGAALAVAVYVTKVPIPFTNKNQPRTPEQDAAESRKNQNWDPNAPLYGKNPAKAASAASEPATPAAESAPAASAPPAPAAAPVAPAPASAPPVFAPGGTAPPAAAPRAGADPLGDLAARRAASAPAGDPFQYFVQAGAFRSAEEAQAQRAKLSLMGLDARVSERDQAGRTVFRVRVGPFDRKEDADRSKGRLDAAGIESALVRVPR